jgi:undecaprenyl-diphosphatase
VEFWQAIFLGFLQGATELFPVSSLGHAVLLPRLLGWKYDQSDPAFLPYIVLLHLGTAIALIVYFRQDWVALIAAFFRAVARGRLGEDLNEKLVMMLMIGTIPAALLGVTFERELKKLFASPRPAAAFLLVNAVIMGAGEFLRRRSEQQRGAAEEAREESFETMTDLSFRSALAVGASQCLALFPGISRSGTTITTGILVGLRHEAAARFSFLLATPIILAAGLLEVPSLFDAGARVTTYLLGAVVAGITAYLSTRFLVRYFQSGRLDPFAAYCAVLGVVGLVFIK